MHGSPVMWLSGILALGALFVVLPRDGSAAGVTPGSLAVMLFAAWVVVSNRWLNPSYHPAGTYHALFLATAFFVGRRAGEEHAKRLFVAALGFGVCLAAWALWQRAHGVARASALLETPATLAALANLLLLPVLVAVTLQRPRLPTTIAAGLLAAVLFAAGSRGGWLAFCVGLLAAVVAAGRMGLPIGRAALVAPAACLVAGLVLAGLASLAHSLAPSAGPAQAAASMTGQAAVDSAVDRLGMYELALDHLVPGALLTGIGYLGFYYVHEAGSHALATIAPGSTYFVHNDYLQTLLELGLPGIVLLLAVIVLPLLGAWRCRDGSQERRMLVVALAAALASMAAHAAVDYPFYVPACLVLFGAAAGILDRITQTRRVAAAKQARMVQVALATLAGWMLATPALAEAAALYAHRQWQAGAGQPGLWFEIARRIEPRDWRYHWQAGQFWYAQAVPTRDARAARLAETAFAEGARVNSRDPHNRRARAAARRDLGQLLGPRGRAP